MNFYCSIRVFTWIYYKYFSIPLRRRFCSIETLSFIEMRRQRCATAAMAEARDAFIRPGSREIDCRIAGNDQKICMAGIPMLELTILRRNVPCIFSRLPRAFSNSSSCAFRSFRASGVTSIFTFHIIFPICIFPYISPQTSASFYLRTQPNASFTLNIQKVQKKCHFCNCVILSFFFLGIEVHCTINPPPDTLSSRCIFVVTHLCRTLLRCARGERINANASSSSSFCCPEDPVGIYVLANLFSSRGEDARWWPPAAGAKRQTNQILIDSNLMHIKIKHCQRATIAFHPFATLGIIMQMQSLHTSEYWYPYIRISIWRKIKLKTAAEQKSIFVIFSFRNQITRNSNLRRVEKWFSI